MDVQKESRPCSSSIMSPVGHISGVFLSVLSVSYFPLFPIPASHQEEEEKEDVWDKEILLRDL